MWHALDDAPPEIALQVAVGVKAERIEPGENGRALTLHGGPIQESRYVVNKPAWVLK